MEIHADHGVRLQPLVGATPATWWILLTAQNNTDKKLYSKLASCVCSAPGFHPYVWKVKTTSSWAGAYLRAVRDELEEEGMRSMIEQFDAYDDYSVGAGRTDG